MTHPQFTPSGSHVIDPTGKEWPTEVWHYGLNPWSDNLNIPPGFNAYGSYWLVRKPLEHPPLPPLPKALTQDQIDHEALVKKCRERGTSVEYQTYGVAFRDGVTYARSNPIQTRSDDELFEEWLESVEFTYHDTLEHKRNVFNSILAVIRKETK